MWIERILAVLCDRCGRCLDLDADGPCDAARRAKKLGWSVEASTGHAECPVCMEDE